MSRDTRICFVGDSFVAGVGDPTALGWAGRLVADAHACGHPVTAYNLGVRRQTSTEIRARWLAECVQRFPDDVDARVVFSFGVNDTMAENGRRRVDAADSVANLTALLAEAADRDWPALVVAPPPIDDDEHNARTAALDARFAVLCATAAVPYVRIHQPLGADPVWRHEVRIGDGAHPGAGGYTVLADLIRPAWREWLVR
ncbi:GDSL-type esterase/lipase family protein [Nocardia cyriacigeorgica]|uniref:GDSL-type esterase/lipase family protein n=1 Tax=Nocardia cyriacigeorgica TaxID=135487 RepID=UPI0018946474|nr:GDSL-type esterase/lipase family protein [Nocardia cyriacigeorgica]MBF6412956.1 G-D-S-L family lipolytic protein [Nocardia cyriacigeorgica]